VPPPESTREAVLRVALTSNAWPFDLGRADQIHGSDSTRPLRHVGPRCRHQRNTGRLRV